MSEASKHPDGEPWQWPEATWRRIVGAGAGRTQPEAEGLAEWGALRGGAELRC